MYVGSNGSITSFPQTSYHRGNLKTLDGLADASVPFVVGSKICIVALEIDRNMYLDEPTLCVETTNGTVEFIDDHPSY